jgi:hypothetical protein
MDERAHASDDQRHHHRQTVQLKRRAYLEVAHRQPAPVVAHHRLMQLDATHAEEVDQRDRESRRDYPRRNE